MPVLTDNLVRTPDVAAVPLRIGNVALAVRDLAGVERFYRDVIGLRVVQRGPDSVSLGAGGPALLTLRHVPGAIPDDPAAAGLFHIAFLLPSRADLGRWIAHASALGHALDGAADHLVSEAAYLHDPEGNGVEIYADRPRAQWRWDVGQLAMANSRLDFPGLLREGAGAAWSEAPAGVTVGHVHLRVGNIAAAVRFYKEALGLDVVRSMPEAAFMSTGGYHHHIAVNTWSSAGAGPRDPRRAGLDSVTLEAADQAVLDGIAQRAGMAADQDGLRDPWGTLLRFRLA